MIFSLYTQTPATEATVEGLIEGNVYQFRVRAVNKAGPSEPSDATEPHLAKPRNCKIIEIDIKCSKLSITFYNLLSLQKRFLFRYDFNLIQMDFCCFFSSKCVKGNWP